MAYNLILGFNGSNIVLDYPGTNLVVMETPCPYALWDHTTTVASGGDLTFSSGDITFTCNTAGRATMAAACTLFMLLTEVGGTKKLTLTFTGSKSGYTGNYAISASTVVNSATAGTTDTLTNAANTDTLAVPYYRYRIEVTWAMDFGGGVSAVGDWSKVSIALS